MFGYRVLGLGGSHPNRGGGGRVTITLTISSDVNNYDIQANRGGTYEAGNTDVIVINNAHIKSTASNTHALQTGSTWTSGDTITIDNNSLITADGGNGGAGGAGNGPGAGQAGGAGGFAISINYPVSIDNTGGTISGGGGGGGGGGGANTTRALPKSSYAIDTSSGGGGGGGAGTGQGGAAGATGSGSGNNNTGTAGNHGSLTAGGGGGAGASSASQDGGRGNAGGGLGAVGVAGAAADAAGGAGGAAGKAVNLNGNAITWIANGTRNGATS